MVRHPFVETRLTIAFLDIHGPRIETYAAVASTRYRPEFSSVPFTVDAKDVLVDVRLPSWDTHRTFNPEPSLEVGRVGDITVSGSYRYYATHSPDHQEKLKLTLDAENVAFKALGWVVRRIFCVKDNYFGTFTQFSTMQEFLEKFDHSPDAVGDPIVEKYRPGRSDSFAVNLTVNVRDSMVVMSDEIYGCDKGIVIPVPQLQLDLRNNEYQMDMSVDLAPTYVVACNDLEQCYLSGVPPLARDQDVVFVEGLDIKANRLFGPQPKGTTYVCLWELSIGHISAFLSPEFKDTLAAVGSAVGYNYTDRDNAPSAVYIAKTPPDATFVKLSIQRVTALLTAGTAGVAIELPQGVFIDTSSVASQACRSVQGLGVPCASIHVLRKRDGHKTWQPVGSVSTGLAMDTYKVPPGWKEDAEKQQEFLREQDAATKRVPYLYGEKDDPAYGRHENEIYVPRPRPMEPSWDDETSLYTYEEANDDSSSAGEVDEIDDQAIPRVSRRRRAMSRARAAEVESLYHGGNSSIGDESDTCSSFSSSSASSSNTSLEEDVDPTTILENKLLTFKKIHERARRLFAHEPSTPSPFVQEPQDLFEPLCITEGAVQRISLMKTTVEITPATIEAAAYLAVGLQATSPRPEVQLDQLLTYQVDSLLKNGLPRNPKLFVINAPLAELRLVAGPSYSHPDSVTRVSINSSSSRVLSTPIVDSTKSILEATVGVGALTLTAYRNGAPAGSLALSDIPDVPVPAEPKHNKLLPYTCARALDLGVTVHQEPESLTIQSKVTALEVHSATPGVPVISNILDIWMPVIKSLPKSPEKNTAEALLYDILTQAITTSTSLSLPSFMYEASYGLHLDDQRNIRRDVGWGAIQRLRYWMRQMDQQGQFQPNVIRPSGPSMAKTIVMDLAKVDDGFGQTVETVANIPFLTKVLSKDLQAAGCAPPPTPNQIGVYVRLERGEVRHYGRQLQTDNIAWSMIKIEAASVAYANLKTYVENLPLSNVRSVISVRNIEFDLKDSSFAANEAIIRHIDAHRKEIKELKVVEAVEGASTVVIDVHLDRFKSGLTFGGMRGETSLDHGQVAVTLERRCSNANNCTLELEQRTCIFNCAALESVLAKCPDDPRDESAPVPIITAALRGIKAGMATNFNSQDHLLSFQRVLVGLESLDFDSRPQLKHFYEFVQDWRKRFWPLYEPYWKKFEAMIKKQKARLAASNSPGLPSPPPSGKKPERKPVGDKMIDGFIGKARLQLRGSEKLWLRWDMNRIYGAFRGTPESSKFGGRIDPQTIGGYSQYECIRDKQASIISLPEITGTGNYHQEDDKRHLGMNIGIGMFTGIIKPIVLDRLLSLHQKVGKDVTSIIREMKATWGDKSPKSGSSRFLKAPDSAPPKPALQWSFDAQTSIAGVRVGLRAENVPTTLMFEALDLQASASNVGRPSVEWMAKANHVGLSLRRLREKDRHAMRSAAKPLDGPRSAYMVFDFSAEEIPGNPSKLNIEFKTVHTVMHIAALSEVSDLIKSWSADLTVLREVHKDEVDDVKEEATKVFKKIEGSHMSTVSTGTQESNATAIESWLKSRVLKLGVHGFGIAIPLDEDATIDLSKRYSTNVPALLFSIRAMDLKTSRTETARFKVLNTELQFVNSFDPGQSEQFVGDFHSTDNKMKLPNIEAEAQLTSNASALLVTAHCQATDFHLCLTPEIADGIGKLVDLYELGKGQLEALEREYRAEWGKNSAAESQPESLQSKYDAQVQTTPKAVTVRMSFRFHSGLVELHRPTVAKSKRIHRDKKPEHDLVVLPSVSLWMEYMGPTSPDESARTLLFNAAVHESKNVLRPTILPFFIELVNRIERRAKSRVATNPSSTVTPAPSQIANRSPEMPLLDVGERTDRAMAKVEDAPTGKVRLRVTLRIDKSELRLSCKEDSSAYLDLKWESGGFVAATMLGGKHTTTLAGSVSGVTVFLSHEFASMGQPCVEGGAKDLAFSLALCSEEGNRERGLSIVVDTGVSAELQFATLSAWFEFACVWIENAPKFDLGNKDAPASSMTSTSAQITSTGSTSTVQTSAPCSTAVRSKLGVAALIRFRSIDFNAKLGVTNAHLKLAPVVLRTVTDGEETELDLTVGETTIQAEGEVSGNLISESLKFHTIRRSSRSGASFEADPTVLKMSIDGGDLRGAAFIGDNNIVRFRLEPSRVTLVDNWKEHAHNSKQPVALDFIVDAGQFTGVLKLPSIPRLLEKAYTVLDQISSTKATAAHRSKTFRLKQQQKRSENNNSVMVLNSSTPNTPTAEQKLNPPKVVGTAQLMKFELKGLDVGLFVNDYDDGTVADFLRFYVGKVGADLTRSRDDEQRPVRNLHLHVDFVEWQTCDGRRAAKVERHDQLAGELISAAMKHGYKVVVMLPRMTLDMGSTQEGKTVLYDFDVVWGDSDGDVKVVPKFLGFALKSFRKLHSDIQKLQLDRAKKRGDVRAQSAAALRKARKIDPNVKDPEEEATEGLTFKSRSAHSADYPLPKLRALGETTGDAAAFLDWATSQHIKNAVRMLPEYSHKFVTLPLEEGMDLLLKLYQKQLPDIEDDAASTGPARTGSIAESDAGASKGSAAGSVGRSAGGSVGGSAAGSLGRSAGGSVSGSVKGDVGGEQTKK